MGLTIHFTLNAPGASAAEAGRLVRRLREAALALPFDQVGPIMEVPKGHDSLARPEAIPCVDEVTAFAGRLVRGEAGGRECWCLVRPVRAIAFKVAPGQGCEECRFGLGRYPQWINHEGRRLPTGLDGWLWSNFCKTQYSANPALGGLQHFLRCHIGIINLLDGAKKLGIVEEVKDEGGYWEKRDVGLLVKEIAAWNRSIAGFVGRLQDRLEEAGGDRRNTMSAISEFPDFEHLEAEGRRGEDEEHKPS